MLSMREKIYVQNINRLKIKGLQKTYHVSSNHKRARIAIIISDKRDFMPRNIARGIYKEGYFIKGVLNGCNLIISIIFTAS